MSQRKRRTQKSFSQPSTSTRHDYELDEEETISSSQISPNKSLTNQEHSHYVANVVKYILAASHSNIPIVRSTIAKNVNCHGKNLRSVMNSAEMELKDVFGYKLIDLDNGKFILCNTILNELPHLKFDEEVENRYVLLFLTLVHIYMSGEVCSENSLVHFFIRLNIIREGDMRNETFGGNILDIIKGDFVKERYIELEKCENNENSEPDLRWGIRSVHEISVRSIMEFVSKVYEDRDMKSWPQQYETMLKKEKPINRRSE